jgi:hypothetical protein
MSYYFSTFSYSSSFSDGKKKESAKGYSKSSNGPEQFFIYDKDGKNVKHDIKGERKKETEKFNVLENDKKIKKDEKEVYDLLVKSNPKIDPKYIMEFLNSNEYKSLKENNKKLIKNSKEENNKKTLTSNEKKIQKGG